MLEIVSAMLVDGSGGCCCRGAAPAAATANASDRAPGPVLGLGPGPVRVLCPSHGPDPGYGPDHAHDHGLGPVPGRAHVLALARDLGPAIVNETWTVTATANASAVWGFDFCSEIWICGVNEVRKDILGVWCTRATGS